VEPSRRFTPMGLTMGRGRRRQRTRPSASGFTPCCSIPVPLFHPTGPPVGFFLMRRELLGEPARLPSTRNRTSGPSTRDYDLDARPRSRGGRGADRGLASTANECRNGRRGDFRGDLQRFLGTGNGERSRHHGRAGESREKEPVDRRPATIARAFDGWADLHGRCCAEPTTISARDPLVQLETCAADIQTRQHAPHAHRIGVPRHLGEERQPHRR